MTVPRTPDFRLHATLSGRVQGVGFRYFVLQAAQEVNLTGWVRNLQGGRVEVMAEGSHTSLNSLLAKLRIGPTSAVVEDIDYDFSASMNEFDRFRVRPTG